MPEFQFVARLNERYSNQLADDIHILVDWIENALAGTLITGKHADQLFENR